MKRVQKAPPEFEPALIEWMKSQPMGATSAQIAEHFGMKQSTARKYCRLSNGVVSVWIAKDSRWCLPEQVEAVEEYRKHMHNEYARREAERKSAYRRDLNEADVDWIPQQVRIDARTAPPIPKLGPASVWELAA